MAVQFGQIVIGPPGSGKTTYCQSMKVFLETIGRKVAMVNLDPANDRVEGKLTSIDIRELISLHEVMEIYKLGPNGSLLYILEFLEMNIEWLLMRLRQFNDHYFVFDMPGQIELYTHHQSVKNIMKTLQKEMIRLVCVTLADSSYCCDASNFIAMVLQTLSSMLNVELPHINFLSKIDLLSQYSDLEFNMEYYTEVLDLKFLAKRLRSNGNLKFKKMNKAISELVQDYSLVTFFPLTTKDDQFLQNAVNQIDKAGGYIFASRDAANLQDGSLYSMNSVSFSSNSDTNRSHTLTNNLLSANQKDKTKS